MAAVGILNITIVGVMCSGYEDGSRTCLVHRFPHVERFYSCHVFWYVGSG